MKYAAGGIFLYAYFFLMCFLGTGSDQKNIKSFYSYPDAVQKAVCSHAALVKEIPPRPSMLKSFLSNLIVFTLVFILIGQILRIGSFLTAFLYFLILGQGLNLFDLLIIDALWWRRSPRTKFSFIPNNALYMDMHPHISSFKRAIPVFFCAAFLASLCFIR